MDSELRLTYAELGARLGITAEAAHMIARRRGWIRQLPNRRGAPVYVVVPAEGLASEEWRASDRSNEPDSTDDGADSAGPAVDTGEQSAVAAIALASQLATQLATAQTRVDRAEERADAALALADRLTAQLADAATGRARARMSEIGPWRGQGRTTAGAGARGGADDSARRAKGRLRRAWDGWRGR